MTSDEVIAGIYKHFPLPPDEGNLPHDALKIAHERAAALNLHACTGAVPERVDDGTRNGAVDLKLTCPDGTVAVVEITSSADADSERAFMMSETLTRRVADLYRGSAHWSLHFGKGYEPPANRRLQEQLAGRVAAELRECEGSASDFVSLTAAPWLRAHRVDDGIPGIEAGSWDSRVPDSDQSYIRSLEMLLDSKLMAAKSMKLTEEGRLLHAQQRHLYVFMRPVGANAHAFPRNARELAVPALCLPSGVDVLWLDTRNRNTYKYTADDGLEVFTTSQ